VQKRTAKILMPSARHYALAAAAALVLTGCLALTAAPAQATPGFAKTTGLACQRCHVSVAKPQELTATGKSFKANGDKMPAK
jgi:hypothetical protein